jgi:hypothetical protein
MKIINYYRQLLAVKKHLKALKNTHTLHVEVLNNTIKYWENEQAKIKAIIADETPH